MVSPSAARHPPLATVRWLAPASLLAYALLALLALSAPPTFENSQDPARPEFLAPFRAAYPDWLFALPHSADLHALAGAALTVALFGLYALAPRFLPGQPSAARPTALWPIVAPPAAAALLLALLLPPTTYSTDVYTYGLVARLLVAYGQSPYALPPGAVAAPDDPFRPLVFWLGSTAAHGPLWTLLSLPIARLAGPDPLLAALLFKGLSALAIFAAGALVWALARPAGPSAAERALVFWLWNPLVLLESAGAGHNDPVLALLLLAGLWLAGRGAPPLASFALLAVGGLVKYQGALFAALFLAARLRVASSWRAAFGLLAGAGALALLLAGALFLPFWAPGLRLYDPVAHEPRSQLVFAAVTLARAAGLADAAALRSALDTSSLLAALAVVGWAALRSPPPDDPPGLGLHWAKTALLVVLLLRTEQPWYLLWPLALLAPALDRPGARPWAASAVALALLLSLSLYWLPVEFYWRR